MAQASYSEQRPVAPPTSLASGTKSCAAGVETSLYTAPKGVRNGFCAYMTDLAFSATAGATVEFRLYVNGVRAQFPYQARTTQLGKIGQPQQIVPAYEVQSGGDIDFRVSNTGGVAVDCEVDGTLNYFDAPLR